MKRGLLTRKRTREDARAYAVRLTDEGRRVLLKSMPVMAGVDAAALAIIPTKQRSEFIAFLGKIVERGERKDGSGGA